DRNRRIRPAHPGHAGYQRAGAAQGPGGRAVQRRHEPGTGQDDHRAAHLPGQCADHQDAGPDPADAHHDALRRRGMDRIIYTAAAGAARTLEQQAVISNNMANASTAGFREQLALNRAVPIVGENMAHTRVSTVATTPGTRMQPGVMAETGHALD